MSRANDVCVALAETISSSVEGLYCKPHIDDVTVPPEAQISTLTYDPRFTFGSTNSVIPMRVRVFVPRVDPQTAQEQIRDYMEPTGPYSIKAAVEDGDNWDAQVHDVSLTEVSEVLEVVTESGAYFAVDFTIDVYL